MHSHQTLTPQLYYTTDHEWIDFQDNIAYTGICRFKLLGFNEIHSIAFAEPQGFKKRGEIIARIKYNEYQIEAHMPVDGRLVQLNDALNLGDLNVLLRDPENNGWIAIIEPSNPGNKKGLLLPTQYDSRTNTKFPRNKLK